MSLFPVIKRYPTAATVWQRSFDVRLDGLVGDAQVRTVLACSAPLPKFSNRERIG